MDKSALILNADASIYHLNLHPHEIANTIFLVGDPDRVPLVSRHFDHIEIQKQKRELVTHTGTIGQQRVSVVSTGMGVGSIDIVLNELDALVNIDFKTYQVKEKLTKLNLIRLGTCGSLSLDIPVDAQVVSEYAIAFDGLMQFYRQPQDESEKTLLEKTHQHFSDFPMVGAVYVAKGSASLINLFKEACYSGITATAVGFYGPQHRQLRAPLFEKDILDKAATFQFNGLSVVNFEMETAAIYGLSRVFGHRCCSISTVVANRIRDEVSRDSKRSIEQMIEKAIELCA